MNFAGPVIRASRSVASASRASRTLLPQLLLLAGLLPAPSAAQSTDPLIGVWEFTLAGEAVMTMTLRADGTGSMEDDHFTWIAKGNSITFTLDSETMVYQYAMKDGSLTLSGGDLDSPIILTRKGDPGARSDAPTTSADRRGGSVAMELLGKWCYMANVHANDGGRMSNECITFHPDGTYEYYRETSSSGQYGSSASQESDTGTWSLEGEVLKAQSRSYGPLQYTLEKRNHPKNVNDPMIVLDGRAFVTYEQRAPW